MGRGNKIEKINTNISVVIPTCNRYKVVLENIKNIRQQNVSTEIIICDDSHIDDRKQNLETVQEITKLADKYVYTALYDHEGNKLYGLGRARNKGVIEANNEMLVFLDDRITPNASNMLQVFADKLEKSKKGGKIWFFGDKGAQKTSFVENCSATWRQDLITAGMFSESINAYGFMTRELFSRLARQGWQFVYVPEALATPLCTGSRRNNEERDKQIAYARSMLKKMNLV
jgi:glycosyltransferase involved in cell wall biosynthesis